MFNLVAFKDGDKMKVLPLNDFYSDGVTYEVTKYIDSNKSSVEKLQQFKNIIFDFKSKKSFLVQKAEEINGVKFAHEQVGNNDWDGGNVPDGVYYGIVRIMVNNELVSYRFSVTILHY